MSDVTTRLLQLFQDALAITPNDSTDLARPAQAIYVGTAGNIALKTMNNVTVTFVAVPAGIFDVSAKRIYSTSTTAGGLTALYTTAPDSTTG